MTPVMRRGRALVLAVMVCGLAPACSHVELSLPPPHSDRPTREAAHAQLRPKRAVVLEERQGAHVSYESPFALVLGSGVEVVHPEDLLPVVRPSSLTARNVAAFRVKEKGWNLWGGVAATTFLLPAVTLGTLLLVDAVAPGTLRELDRWPVHPLVATIPIAILGPLVSLIIGAVTVGNLDAERAACFRSYGGDLQDALDLAPSD